jgi:hypothetical protein
MSAPLAIDLELALPIELTGSTHNWFNRYRRYPVFSRAWTRGRQRSWSIVLALFLLFLVATMLFYAEPGRLPAGMAQVLVLIVTPMWLGPWLAGWVRRQHWPARREQWSLWTAVLVTVALMQLFVEVGAEPMKQFIAEKTGNVDPQGKRRQVVMSIGVNISQPDSAASAASGPDGKTPTVERTSVANRASSLGLTFWLAGGMALVRLAPRTRRAAGVAGRARARRGAGPAPRGRAAVVGAGRAGRAALPVQHPGRRAQRDPQRPAAGQRDDRPAGGLPARVDPRLRSDGSAQATVAAQFELVRAYLGLMSARMPRLQFSLELPAELLAARCPPLMLISLAENAVKHGVEPKIGPVPCRAARASATPRATWRCRWLDDGAGFGASQAGSGLGLTNIRERLRSDVPGTGPRSR